jgi:nicotinamidase-related amidase
MAQEALLICDMLDDFVREGAPLEVPETRKIIPAIRREIERARKEGDRIIYIVESHEPEDKEFSKFGWPPHGITGTPGAQVIDELKPEAGDITIGKPTYASFHKTSLDETLKSFGIKSIRLTGCVTHICIFFTAYEGVLLDYEVSVVRDAVAGIKRHDHDAALRMMKNVLGVNIL